MQSPQRAMQGRSTLQSSNARNRQWGTVAANKRAMFAPTMIVEEMVEDGSSPVRSGIGLDRDP